MLMLAALVSSVVVAAASAPGSCTTPDGPARIDRLVTPAYTEAMKDRHVAGVVDVSVDVAANGAVSRALITQTSGDDLLDAATYAAAVATTYAPAVRGCTDLAGSTVYRARFRAYPMTPAGAATGGANLGPPAFPPLPERTFGPVRYASDVTPPPGATAATARSTRRPRPAGASPSPG